MPIARIVVAPIPTTDWWVCHLIDADKPCGVPRSAIRPTRDSAITHARNLAECFDCPVVTYPKEN